MKELFLHLVCLPDIDDTVKNHPITVLFNHEVIAIIETMAPTLYTETVKMLMAFNVFEVFDI